MGYERNIRLIYGIWFLGAFLPIIPVFVPFFVNWGGLSYAKAFFLEGWFMMCMVLLEVPTGAVADKISRKFSIFLGFAILTLGTLAFAVTPNFWLFLLGESLWGLGVTFISGATEALLFDSLKAMGAAKKSKGFFLNMKSMELTAIAIVSPIGGYLAGINLRLPMLASAFFLMLGAFLALFLKEPPMRREKGYSGLIRGSFRHLFQNKPLLIMALDFVLIGAFLNLSFWLWQAAMMNAGLSLYYFGIVAAIIMVFSLIVIMRAQMLEKHFGAKRLLRLTTALPGLMYIICGLTLYVPIIVGAMCIISAAFHIREPFFNHYMNQLIPSKKRATVLSVVSMMSSVSVILGYIVTGALLDWSVQNTMLIIGAILLAMALFSKVTDEILDGNSQARE